MESADLELIYELSPMQQAMLFHSLYAPGSGVYVIQLSLRLTGRLDVSAFERAWQHLVDRHDVLRTAFFWEGLDKPLQVVYRETALEVRRESWRGLGADEQRSRLDRFLEAERERGFDPAEAPLMRLALFDLEPEAHQMVWTIHHLLVDGWSQGQLLRELFTAYAAFSRGREPRLPAAGKFRDYVAWLQRQDLGAAEAFWRDRLAGLSTPTFIAGGDGKGGPGWREARRQDLTVPAAATAALREAARRHRLTLNTLVQGAWSLLLAQESGRGDVVFGTTVSGRPADLPGVESILGLFINTQPVRVALRPEQGLWDWLARLQQDQVEMRRYEHSPLVDVQRWSALPAGVPLFDHLLVFENAALPAELSRPLPELEIAEEAAHELTNYPLNVVVIPGDELRLSMRYDAGRFAAASVARMLERLARVLEDLAAGRERTLTEVARLPERERHQVLVEWGGAGGLPQDRPQEQVLSGTLHGRFEARARQTPDAPAATCGGASVTYAELERRANQLARHLRSLDVRPDDRVGLCGERSLELLEGILGILKAGGAYVPLDPKYPRERLAWMIGDAGIRAVVGTAEPLAALISDGAADGIAAVPLDAHRERLRSLPGGPLPPVTDGAGLAYVIYTSGSTGRPKGVLVSHANVVRLFDATQPWFRFGARDVWTLFHSYAFDFSVWEIWGALLYGGRVVVVPWEVSRSPELFLDLLASEKVTVLNQTPSAFAQLARADEERGGVATGLRLVIFGGEALDAGGLAPWFDRHGDQRPRLVNMYGITETTVHVTYRPLRREDAAGARRSVIGARIPDLGLYLLDPWLQPVPIGAPGELVVGGAGLARGYLSRPELTAERFVPDPVGGEPGARLYRSGDLGRFLPDGDLEYLGRIDHQVKIRGFRIELGEIEAVLGSHPAVRECVVVAREDRPGSSRLVGYVVLHRTDPTDSKAALAAWLRGRLPEHMVPAAFVPLPALPLTQNGKVDRTALPAPDGIRAAEESYVAPSDPVEELLAGLWAEVLGPDRVGVHDDFFALGGHSLLATQLVSRLRQTFGLEIPLRALFEAPTVAGLAERIDEQAARLAGAGELDFLIAALDPLADEEARARVDDPRAVNDLAAALARAFPAPPGPEVAEPGRRESPEQPVPLPRPEGGGAFPLSFAQQRLWFLDQLEPDSAAYNLPLPVRLRGELPAALLERVFAGLVRRHEALRTTFAARGDQPVQVVHPDLLPALARIDLSDLPEAEREERARQIADQEAALPFDLRTGPLLRLTLVRLAARDHLLLVNLHHIVSDGWSMQVLLRELVALYEALSREAPAVLPELPFQYADFAVWQRQWLRGEVLEEQLAFWRRRLAGAPQRLELPTDRPRPAVQTSRGATRNRRLEPSLAAAVGELCRREDVTPFMALLAAWALLLGRLAGQDGVLVGTPIAGRHLRGSEHLIGFFVNTLVLRIGLDGEALSFRQLLGRVRQASLEAFTHQDVPFERLVEELVPERDLSRSPLFQVMFALQNAPGAARQIPGLAVQAVAVTGRTAKFDLGLTVSATPGGFEASVEHNTDLFDGSTVERLLARLELVLEGAVRDPGLPVAGLPWLLAGERQQVLLEWNETAAAYPREASLPERFAAVVAEQPDAPAVVDEDGTTWSYRGLHQASSRLARHLAALGIGPGARVGVAMERSADLLVALLAVLQAGAAYVPLDPGHPDERLAFLLEDAGAALVLVHGRTRDRLETLGAQTLCLERDREALAARSASPLPPRVPAEALAYVIYTSGSTGRPKGVAVSHRAILRLVLGARHLTLSPGDRLAFNATTSFDAATFEIWGTLLLGATLVVIPRDLLLSLQDLAAVLRRERVTVLHLTTSVFNHAAREAPEIFPPLRCALFGGEASDAVVVARLLEAGRPQRLLHMYGPTESTTFATWHEVTGPAPVTVPVGRPLANTTAYVLEPAGTPAAPGQPGELFLGGDGLAWGYLNRPELTAERFVPDPLGAPGTRLYRTGDLVRLRADGTLEFQGRIDEQVKIRGVRIEPGEVEATLARHPGVAACAVVAREDPPGERRLVAYVVLGPIDRSDPTDPTDRSDAKAALAAWLSERLPDAVVPSAWVFLETLPLTPNGKLDRRALPAPEAARGADREYVAPSDPVEERLAAIWAEVLGADRVGVHDDFFALGGHSLLATQVVSRIRRMLRADLPLRRLFEQPTVAALARAVRAAREAGPPSAPPLVPAPRGGDLPLSFAQQRLWFLDRLEPGSAAYNIPLAVRLTGELSAAALERVFAEVLRRHEALRTTFDLRAGRPVQVIADEIRRELPFVDLSEAPAEAREEWAGRLALEEAWHPFDLQRGPLLRLGLLRLGAREHLLLVTVHHIVSDGWSTGVLLREIEALYTAFVRGEPSPLPELPLQYADFAAWQRSWLQGEVLEEQLAYWRWQLAGAPALLELPTDRPRPAVQTAHGGATDLALPPALSAAVRDLCRREGATPFMLLLAAWAVLLGRHAGQDDVLVGTPIAGRNQREIEELIGLFVNTLVIRVRLAASSFTGLLAAVRATALEAYAHQDLPFEQVVEELAPERDLSYSPLFQVLFALQNAPGGSLRLPGLSLAPVDLAGTVTKFDLSLAFQEGPEGFAGTQEHNADLFDRTTAARLLARFEALLAAALAGPGRKLADLPLLLPAERQQILAEWNDTPEAFAGSSLPDLFALQLARDPGVTALVTRSVRWTYAVLAVRAGGMARRLRALGVGPETRVAVCLERSADLIATLLGVLAAGGAYVPIDPAYPVERRALMLADSGAAVLVSRGRLAADLPETAARLVDLDAGPPPEALLPSGFEVLPGHLAYVIYTSGSTGRPKGVAIEHRSAVARAGWARAAFSAGELSGVLAATSVCFDLSVFEIFATLASGGTVILAEDALELPELPAASEVRLVNTVPSAATALVRSGRLPDSVRTVSLAGEPLPAALAAALYATGTVRRVLNLYGPSEDTTYSTGASIPRAAERAPAIGRPLPGTRAWVVDPAGRPVPVGVAGELWLAGAGLARGYLNRPELTAERFAPDPWGEPGGRVYRTGDLVRHRADGELEFLGRIDFQVKVRGFRIELGEIEAALRGHPAVREAVVMVREDRQGSPLLVGYAVLNRTDRSDPTAPTDLQSALAAWLGGRLPDFMVPSAFVILEALPLTATGKVDRKALPDPEHRVDAAGSVPPADALEERLANLWREVLPVDRIGRHDSFFALGGHSLLATQVVTRVRETMGIDLPLRAMFQAPTLAQLASVLRGERPEDTLPAPPEARVREAAPAPIVERTGRALTVRLAGLSPEKRELLDAVLRERRAQPAAAAAPLLPREDPSAPAPLSFSQERMWFLHLLDPLSGAFNVFLGVRLEGALRPALLAAAFRELIRRHQILVTRYELSGGAPRQVVDPGQPFALPEVDLSALPAARRAAELGPLQAEESARLFDLVHGPVLRACLVRLAPAEHLLLLTVHHMAMDGWSLRILMEELAALYQAFAAGEPSPLPPPRLQYADFAVWQRRRLQGEALEAEIAWWRRHLAPPLPVLALPTDRPHRAPQPYHLSAVEERFPAGLAADLSALGAGRGASLFMVLLAGLGSILHRAGGDERIVVGTPVAGRNRREVEELIGCFLNNLLLRVDLDGDPGFGELLQRTAGTALEAFAHQDLPVELLLQELRLDGGDFQGSRGPFQVMLLLQNLRRMRIEVPGLTLTGLGAPRELALDAGILDLGLVVEEQGEELLVEISYNDQLFERATMQRLSGHLRALLEGAVADPGARLSALPLLSPAERREVSTWNRPLAATAGRDPVPALFAAQAARTPGAEALRHRGRRMSYGELERRSRAIAERLQALGAGPEVPVAVFLERSPELIAALLGVLRAGGAYAPLDPAFPAERLRWILEDLAPAVLVTDSALAPRIPWTGKVLFVDGEDAAPRGIPLPPPVPEQTAYVIYTSGSTGRPKGVAVPHGALAAFVAAARELYGIGAGDRVLQFASLGFDTSVEEIWPCLTAGGTLVLRTDEMAGTVDGFLRGCEEHGITVLDLPTAFWHELVTSPELAERGLPAALRLVILGGERPLPERVASWLRRTDPRVRLFNTYGPTEATVVATAAELLPAHAGDGWREVSMGRPLRGVQAHGVDATLRPVPVDVPGELLVGGLGVARGYRGRPDLTAERFLPDPFSGVAGARLYRTGDRVRRRADGTLEFAGRVDEQVKIRGFRVEPGEIESALAACPEVGECAVVAREEGTPGDLRLVAYVVPAPGRTASASVLRAFLDERLPAWMVPSAFVPLSALPRTPTGKIDRRGLPAPDPAAAETERLQVAPRNEIEEVIAEIWRDALKVERLSVFDGFFELGGHSLLLLQVMRRLRDAFEMEIPLRSIYEERTIAALAKKVEELLIEEVRATP
ncbi:MAG TPA: amino acid adenylation domain-containing protein [Thermoanaerobaculia bacterium]|nr:amino acid adenylation domain-containing protein [Thermoanaerobaculia bacterium]